MSDTQTTAIKRVRRYLAMRDAKPMPHLGNDIHCVNSGTEWEGNLTLSDLRDLLAERDRLTAENERLCKALRDLLEDTQHAKHNCGDDDCPVANARALLEGKP